MHFEKLGWPLVYQDGDYLLYLRPDHPALQRMAPYFVLTWERSFDEIWSRARSLPVQAAKELRRIDFTRVRSGDDFFCFGRTAVFIADPRLAETIFSIGIERCPDDLRLRFERALLLTDKGDLRGAAADLEVVAGQADGTPLGRGAKEALIALERRLGR